MSPSKIITISILIFVLLSALSGYIGFTNPIWVLNETQILYLFSTSAQVLAGVYGLTLTGFIFFRNELSREEFDDNSLTDAVESLKERYFILLVFITLFSVFTLLVSNLVISIEVTRYSSLRIFFINVGQVSFAVNLIVITYFIFDVIAPKRIERASKNLQETFDPMDEDEEKGSLEKFLTNFNKIESILQKYGQAFQLDINDFQYKSRKIFSNVKLAQIILQSERIDLRLFEEIKRLITLRNSIVHGEEPIVSSKIVLASSDILIKLSNALGVHVAEN